MKLRPGSALRSLRGALRALRSGPPAEPEPLVAQVLLVTATYVGTPYP